MSSSVSIFRLALFRPSETFIVNQAMNLRRYRPVFMGHRIQGIKPHGAEVLLPSIANNMSALRLSALPPSFRSNDLASLDSRPKLVHAHFGIDGIQAMKLADTLSTPLIVTLHGFDVTRTTASFLLSARPHLLRYALLRRSLFERAGTFICVSNFIRQAALNLGFPESKLKTHYIGIQIPPQETPSVSNGPFLHIARLVEKKGTELLLTAYRKARQHGCTTPLSIIGDGPLLTSLKEHADSLHLQDSVTFHGALPNHDTLDYLSKAQALIVPSVTAKNGDQEGLPTVILEAFARSVPVIAFDSGGIAEAVIHGYNGWLHPERDIDGLSESIIEASQSTEVRRSRSISSQLTAKDRFDIATQTQSLERIYAHTV